MAGPQESFRRGRFCEWVALVQKAQMMEGLRQPNLVQTFEVGEIDGCSVKTDTSPKQSSEPSNQQTRVRVTRE